MYTGAKIGEIKSFPWDCRGCDKFISYDMSIDDITNICKSNNMQVDDCDMDFEHYRCPEGIIKTNKNCLEKLMEEK